jgi:hypothetical protein
VGNSVLPSEPFGRNSSVAKTRLFPAEIGGSFAGRRSTCTLSGSTFACSAIQKPFRIKIVNNYNEVYDYFYIKYPTLRESADWSWSTLLSPYWINYLVDDDTLVEEHIAGIPGDVFVNDYINRKEFNPKRIAKEFVKFNERCFVRLSGRHAQLQFCV